MIADEGARHRLTWEDARRAWVRLDAAYCLALSAAVFTLILATGALAAALPLDWQCGDGAACSAAHTNWVSRYFIWDSRWYDSIAQHGYEWDPSRRYQNVAFWPLWPIVLWLTHVAAPAADPNRAIILAVSCATAMGSVLAFHALARKILLLACARRATLLFLVYPGSHFLLQSYPVGLMTLLCCLALLALLNGRYWQAAIWAGLGSAAGPLALSVSATVGLVALAVHWLKICSKSKSVAERARLLASLSSIEFMAIGGLILFMVWLTMSVHNPIAFVSAENGWAKSLPFSTRLAKWAKMELIYPDFQAAMKHLAVVVNVGDRPQAGISYETHINSLGLGIGLIAVYGALGTRAWAVVFQSWLAIAMYVWFIGTVQGTEATLRLIYLAPGCFIGAAYLTRGSSALTYAMAALSGALLIVETALSAAGYWVV